MNLRNDLLLMTVPHTGRRFLERLFEAKKVQIHCIHALPAQRYDASNRKVIRTLRDPAGQYASCLRRYGERNAFDWSVPHWEAFASLDYPEQFFFRLDDPDYNGLFEFMGVNNDMERVDTSPWCTSGQFPAEPAEDYPAELDQWRVKYGYATARAA